MKNVTRGMRCTIQQGNGEFCDAVMAHGAPYPICPKHAGKVYEWAKAILEAADVHEFELGIPADEHWPAPVPVTRRYRRDDRPVQGVYYVRVGELVKIGVSRDVANRVRTYPPGSELLAIESGDNRLEKRRHSQFADSLAHRTEWFYPSRRLMAHIETIKALTVAA